MVPPHAKSQVSQETSPIAAAIFQAKSSMCKQLRSDALQYLSQHNGVGDHTRGLAARTEKLMPRPEGASKTRSATSACLDSLSQSSEGSSGGIEAKGSDGNAFSGSRLGKSISCNRTEGEHPFSPAADPASPALRCHRMAGEQGASKRTARTQGISNTAAAACAVEAAAAESVEPVEQDEENCEVDIIPQLHRMSALRRGSRPSHRRCVSGGCLPEQMQGISWSAGGGSTPPDPSASRTVSAGTDLPRLSPTSQACRLSPSGSRGFSGRAHEGRMGLPRYWSSDAASESPTTMDSTCQQLMLTAREHVVEGGLGVVATVVPDFGSTRSSSGSAAKPNAGRLEKQVWKVHCKSVELLSREVELAGAEGSTQVGSSTAVFRSSTATSTVSSASTPRFSPTMPTGTCEDAVLAPVTEEAEGNGGYILADESYDGGSWNLPVAGLVHRKLVSKGEDTDVGAQDGSFLSTEELRRDTLMSSVFCTSGVEKIGHADSADDEREQHAPRDGTRNGVEGCDDDPTLSSSFTELFLRHAAARKSVRVGKM